MFSALLISSLLTIAAPDAVATNRSAQKGARVHVVYS